MRLGSRPGRRRRRWASLAVLGTAAVLAGAIWARPPGLSPTGVFGAGQASRVPDEAAALAPTGTLGPSGAGVPSGPTGTLGPPGAGAPSANDPSANDPTTPHWSWQLGQPLAAADLTGYVWPLRNGRITNAFGKGQPGSFEIDGVTTHDGIDLSTFCGDRILAAHDGVVLGAGRHTEGLMGWLGSLAAYDAKLDADHAWYSTAITVVIDDGNGYRSMYVHLGLSVVKAGQHVRAGELIGYEGATGNATGCHLHYDLFSPLERGWLELDPKIAERTLLPAREIARIDPLLVLPRLDAAGITWEWGARQEP
jgi:murein DD-endopeptidase MepM/ murein hydrolase activator NlpD